jgi:hypothetical protein
MAWDRRVALGVGGWVEIAMISMKRHRRRHSTGMTRGYWILLRGLLSLRNG